MGILSPDAEENGEGALQPPATSQFRAIANHSAARYVVIGGASFLVDFILLALFFQVFGWPLWIATGIAFLTSFVFNYFLQRVFSFGSQASHATTLSKYIALLAFNTMATIGIVWLVDLTGWGWGAGKVTATVVTTGWNYFVYRYWVFAQPKR